MTARINILVWLGTMCGLFGQPVITKQPANTTGSLFSDVKFTISTTGAAPSYQWRHERTAIVFGTNSTLTVTNLQRSDAGDYDVVVTDSSGSVTSKVARLTITPFNSLYFFGFSWTDTQGIFRDGSPSGPNNNPDYWNNRASNGPMWPEFISTNLGLIYVAANNQARGGGASSDQVPLFTAPRNPQLSAYFVWAGSGLSAGNEAQWNQIIKNDLSVNSNAIARLYGKGGREIIIQGQFPDYLSDRQSTTNTNLLSRLHENYIRFNAELEDAMKSYSEQHPDARITFVDVLTPLDAILADPARSGFTKATVDALSDLKDHRFDGPGSDYVYWDTVHPTSKMHRLIAEWNFDAINNSIQERLDLKATGTSANLVISHLRIGREYSLEKSAALPNWQVIQVFTASAGTNEGPEFTANDSRAYFRLKWDH